MQNGKPKGETTKNTTGKKHESRGLKGLAKRCLQFLWLDFIRNIHKIKLWVEIAALAGAFIYAAIAYEQWQAQLGAMKIDQRAWVSVDVSEKIGKFSVSMKNTGKTPALNVIYFAAFSGDKRGVIPEIPKTEPTLQFLVAPGDTQTASNFEMNYLQAFNLGGDRNYVQGNISYDDIFGKTHHTIYCYWTEPPQVRQPGVFPPSTFVMCGDHNKMD